MPQTEVTSIDTELQESAQKVLGKSEELVRARKVSSNICEAMEALSACLPVLKTYSKLQAQIHEKRSAKLVFDLVVIDSSFDLKLKKVKVLLGYIPN